VEATASAASTERTSAVVNMFACALAGQCKSNTLGLYGQLDVVLAV